MRKKIEFLNRIFDLLKCRIALMEYLKEEKLVSDDLVQTFFNEHHTQHAQRIANLLEELSRADKLQLVDYEWKILPFEYLKLTIVSNNNRKEFEYKA